jgi:hypothetical protein
MKNTIKTRIILLLLITSSCTFAQEKKDVIYQTTGAIAVGGAMAAFGKPVQGAPYSATVTNESVQTLSDGNRIVQKSSGTTARDSQGRTRQDAALPAIGNLSAANAPELVFIQDPVAQVSYTLNLTEKTAQKMPALLPPPGAPAGAGTVAVAAAGVAAGAPATETFFAEVGGEASGAEAAPPPPMMFHKAILMSDHAEAKTEDLGSQMMEGVLANGVRTTRTIPTGQIGNEKPLSIVTEVWTSPELKTIVYSKRSDPRMGEQVFRLTNIVRAEPDPALFAVPANYKIVDGPKPILYQSRQ